MFDNGFLGNGTNGGNGFADPLLLLALTGGLGLYMHRKRKNRDTRKD